MWVLYHFLGDQGDRKDSDQGGDKPCPIGVQLRKVEPGRTHAPTLYGL
jgi:hypothetical protein